MPYTIYHIPYYVYTLSLHLLDIIYACWPRLSRCLITAMRPRSCTESRHFSPRVTTLPAQRLLACGFWFLLPDSRFRPAVQNGGRLSGREDRSSCRANWLTVCATSGAAKPFEMKKTWNENDANKAGMCQSSHTLHVDEHFCDRVAM